MIKGLLEEYSARFNKELPKFFQNSNPVVDAMYYSVSNGGKRLRPFLVYECARLFGVSFEQSLNVAASLEFLHSFSLIHDDLPAIDNDDLRRGLPTCHKKFGEATAILAGDGLLTYAFELLTKEEKCPQLVKLLSTACGAFDGMILGEMLDIIGGNDEKSIKKIEELKTGKLIRYACESGAVLGNANEKEIEALINYARKIGIAFQIKDDILDVEGNPELVGKNLNKDSGLGKTTFVSLYGLEKAKLMAQELINEAKDSLKIFGSKSQTLCLLADFIVSRDK